MIALKGFNCLTRRRMKDKTMEKKGTERSPEKTGKKHHKGLAVWILVALLLFVVIVMAVNSLKPDVLTLEDVDRKTKGAYFIRTNQALIAQMQKNWLPK